MARASKWASVGIIAGVTLGGAAVEASTFGMVGLASVFGQASRRPSLVYSAVSSGIDCYRRGDYEGAAARFQEAQSGQESLSNETRQELTKYLDLNKAALQARQTGAKQLRDADEAVKAGKAGDAETLLKSVMSNQFVTPADKQKAQQMLEQLRPTSTGVKSPNESGVPGIVLARAKLQQARDQLKKSNFEAADALAKEAMKLSAVYNFGEDTPAKVMTDLHKTRNDPKLLLAASRSALSRGEFDKAEELARMADSKASIFTFRFSSDSPSKVLRDVQSGRARAKAQKQVIDATASKPMEVLTNPPKPDANSPKGTEKVQGGKENQSRNDQPQSKTAAKSNTEIKPVVALEEGKSDNSSPSAKALLKQARQALQAGKAQEARDLVAQARVLKADYNWWDDTPDKVAADIQRAAPRLSELPQDKNATSVVAKDKKDVVAPATDDPRDLLKLARDQYTAKNLDEAEKLACQARVKGRNAGWGLFEDSPDKLLTDIRKARTKFNREEGTQLLIEARKLYDAGKYKEAREKAYRAERLHGPYSLWDLGDRPQKLIADIDSAEAKNHRVAVPPPPTEPDRPIQVPVAGVEKKDEKAAVAQAVTPKVPDLPPPVWPKETTTTLPDAAVAQAVNTVPVTVDPVKQQAQKLMAECKQCQLEGKLAEARQKAMEAQKLGVAFAADQEGPERVLVHLSGLASSRINSLVQEATDLTVIAGADAARLQKAEQNLNQARELAVTFALDVQPIESKSAWLKQIHGAPVAVSPGIPMLPPATIGVAGLTDVSQQRGLEMLDKARLELRNGNTANARKLAVEVFSGAYGVQPQAQSVLRSIDAEEHNQRRLAANHTYDAGMAAFQRGDKEQSASILRTVEMSLLEPAKQARFREIMRLPEMQPQVIKQVVAQGPTGIVPVVPGVEVPGKASVGDGAVKPQTPEASFSQRVSAMQEVQFQKLRDQGLQVQRDAIERYRAGDSDRALDMLREYLDSLKEVNLDASKVALLKRPIESRLEQFKALAARDSLEKLQASKHETFENAQKRRYQAESLKNDKVKELMTQYHALYKEGKYQEAELAAMKAHELDPDNVAADAAVHIARIQGNQANYQKIKEGREAMVLNGLNDAEKQGKFVDLQSPIERELQTVPHKDMSRGLEIMGTRTEKEREIERSLTQVVSIDFKDQPLKQVITELHELTGVNIVPDTAALSEESISLDRPMTMRLDGVSLKSALNLLLHQAHLTFVIKDEVLQITTPIHARGKLVQKTYSVPDLVIPVDNHAISSSAKLDGVMDKLNKQQSGFSTTVTPYTGVNSLPGGAAAGTPTNGMTAQMTSTAGAPASSSSAQSAKAGRQPGQTMEDVLIATIKNTIAPQSWSDVGGPGTIDYFPLGMALVINQTPDIQEQIAELLAALRRLQDVEVAVEVRFITLSEDFYERIGMDFNVNVVNRQTSKYEPQIVSGQFAPPGYINRFVPSSFVTGLTPANGGLPGNVNFTHDLNIPILSSSFGPAVPPFGAFPIAPGADGGLSLGLAFLSDIQVFMFMEAAQGDRRTNIMQAPKLTMFNGQTSTLTVTDSQFFVTGNIIGLFNGQVVFSPQNQPFPTGLTLSMQPVVSADRRFVRVSLTPTLTNISQPLTGLFPFTTIITPTFDTGVVGQPVPITQYLQQPSFSAITVSTTVSVPDGGTVLLGGLKTLREGRNEFGPPILSKIPWLNRLVKNTGYGRETQSLMMMVTPRIIINEEEEFRATGFTPTAGGL